MSGVIDVRDSDQGDAQRAARTLLLWGVVTAHRPNPEAFANVQRYAEPLDATFQTLLGYHLRRSRTAVRLVRVLDRLPTEPVFRTPSKAPFDRTRLALLALALAALERSGSQTTLTELARHIRRSADRTPGLHFDPDEHPSRLALSHAVRELESMGVMQLTDGSLKDWELADDGEALYDIDRELARQVFTLPGGTDGLARRLLHVDPTDIGRDASRRLRRQRLARRLLEQPALYFRDQSEADQRFLARNGADLLRALESLTGVTGERRAEGLALVDPGRRLSRPAFPASGAAHQVALLLAVRLCADDTSWPTADAPHADEISDGLLAALDNDAPETLSHAPVRERTPAPLVDDGALRTMARALQADVGPALKTAHRDNLDVLITEGMGVLSRYDLVRRVTGGWVLMPALFRYRATTVRATAELQGQLGLFGGPA